MRWNPYLSGFVWLDLIEDIADVILNSSIGSMVVESDDINGRDTGALACYGLIPKLISVVGSNSMLSLNNPF